MCKFAPDKIKSIASEVVPVIYFGEHDTDKATAECWKQAWESLTSGKTEVSITIDDIESDSIYLCSYFVMDRHKKHGHFVFGRNH